MARYSLQNRFAAKLGTIVAGLIFAVAIAWISKLTDSTPQATPATKELPQKRSSPTKQSSGREIVTVIRVIDGDTIDVRSGERKFRIRLLGVDAPEAHQSEKSARQAKKYKLTEEALFKLGSSAKAFLEKLAPVGSELSLENDLRKEDDYQRRLVYAFTPDGTMINEKILKQGHGVLFKNRFKMKYQDRLIEASRS